MFLAGIIFLAEIVIPHHHHHDYRICFDTGHLFHLNGIGSHDEDCHADQTDDHDHSCCVAEFIPIPVNHSFRIDKNFIYSIKYSPDIECNTISVNTQLLFYTTGFIVFNHGHTSLYSKIIQSSSGLRAPPIV